MSNKCAVVLILLIGLMPSSVYAKNLIFPVVCKYGEDCWAVNYVDVDTQSGSVKDLKCNVKTYDGHKGSDFALGSVEQMKAGVDVVAVAGGTVLRMRDQESDTLKSRDELLLMQSNKKECGNGVLIDHGDGLHSIYCHLKQGSIVVKQGDKLRTGQKIGQVGQSGMAEFPHLHIGLFEDGKIIDPFTGARLEEGCGQMHQPYWADGLGIEYHEAAIFDGGFSAGAPDFEKIKRDYQNPKTLPLSSEAFVFWTGLYNVEAGDAITLRVMDPKGDVFVESTSDIKGPRARQYLFAGRKIGNVQLMVGRYEGHVALMRPSGYILERSFDIHVVE